VIRLGGLATEPEFLIDTAAINRKYASRKDDPRRTWTGTTQLPYDCEGESRVKALYEACGRFINSMKKRNWDLIGKLYVDPPTTAYDIDTSIPLLDKREYHIRGVFQFQEPLRPARIEIPSGLVKRDPEHKITAAEAKKVL
jgi:hypothetical protein